MFATIIVNLLRDLHRPESTSNKTAYDLFMEDKEQKKQIYLRDEEIEGSYTPDELNEKMRNKWDNMDPYGSERISYQKMAKNKFTKKFTNVQVKKYLCDYFTINPKYDINKEYGLLYNHFLTRDLTENNLKNTTKEDTNINIIIPYFSLSFVNNLVVFIYIFITIYVQ